MKEKQTNNKSSERLQCDDNIIMIIINATIITVANCNITNYKTIGRKGWEIVIENGTVYLE